MPVPTLMTESSAAALSPGEAASSEASTAFAAACAAKLAGAEKDSRSVLGTPNNVLTISQLDPTGAVCNRRQCNRTVDVFKMAPVR